MIELDAFDKEALKSRQRFLQKMIKESGIAGLEPLETAQPGDCVRWAMRFKLLAEVGLSLDEKYP